MRSSESLKEMLETARPSRDSATYRVKGMPPKLGMPYNGKQISEEELIIRLKEKQATLAQAFSMGQEGLKQFAGMQKYTIKTCPKPTIS